jgi:hypothetical protein
MVGADINQPGLFSDAAMSEPVHGHHTWPMALGGHPNQPLSMLVESEHLGPQGVHAGLRTFEGGWLYPRPGRTETQILARNGEAAVVAGLRRFYRQSQWQHRSPILNAPSNTHKREVVMADEVTIATLNVRLLHQCPAWQWTGKYDNEGNEILLPVTVGIDCNVPASVGEAWCLCRCRFANGAEYEACAVCDGNTDKGPLAWSV